MRVALTIWLGLSLFAIGVASTIVIAGVIGVTHGETFSIITSIGGGGATGILAVRVPISLFGWKGL